MWRNAVARLVRQELLTWLVDDIAPAVKQGASAEDAIIKLATDQNLAPAAVEALGQLFNTAKTVSFLDKAASRGATFRILDVPGLVSRYLTIKPAPATKTANSGGPIWEAEWDEVHSLPSVLKSLVADADPVMETSIPASHILGKTASAPLAAQDIVKAAADVLAQREFDLLEDSRTVLGKIYAKVAGCTISFSEVEADALLLHGDKIKSAVDQAARFCKASHITVERAAGPGSRRLVIDTEQVQPLFLKLAEIQDQLVRLRGDIGSLSKESNAATATQRDTRTSTKPEAVNIYDPPAGESEGGKPERSERPSGGKPQGGGKAPRPSGGSTSSTPSSGGGKGGGGSGAKSVLDDTSKWLSEGPIGKVTDKYLAHAEKALLSPHNSGQKLVDDSAQDYEQASMLQNLLMTDEVLADANPDRVAEIYNTFRATMPSLAADPNVMRVALRSALQHDGIAPFDVKGFLDTQLAAQRMDMNRRQLNDTLYKGKDLPAPKGRD